MATNKQVIPSDFVYMTSRIGRLSNMHIYCCTEFVIPIDWCQNERVYLFATSRFIIVATTSFYSSILFYQCNCSDRNSSHSNKYDMLKRSVIYLLEASFEIDVNWIFISIVTSNGNNIPLEKSVWRNAISILCTHDRPRNWWRNFDNLWSDFIVKLSVMKYLEFGRSYLKFGFGISIIYS